MEKEILCKGIKADFPGEWVEGYYFCMVHDDGRHAHHFIIPLGADLSLGTPIEKIQVEVIPETVCCYTGQTDRKKIKFGKRISAKFTASILTKRTVTLLLNGIAILQGLYYLEALVQ